MSVLFRFAAGALLAASVLLADSPVADAAQSGDRETVTRLLSKKADVNAAQVDGTTALHWAAHNDDIETVRTLLKAGASAKLVNRYGMSALSLACINGNAAIVTELLKAGADPNTALPGGETVLMTCSRTGKADAVQALIAGGADVNARENRRRQTALMWAAADGHVEAVETLLAAGAKRDEAVESGYNAFFFAVREGRIGVVKSLLKAGVDVNAPITPAVAPGPRPASGAGAPRPGLSALVLAVTNGHFELANVLLEAGADPNAAGAGYTALHIISTVRKPGLGDNDPSPIGSGKLSSLDIVRALAKHGADLNARMTKKINMGLTGLNTVGATPFLMAARTADAELMRELARLGADPLLPNADGSTPLMAAAGLGTRSPGEDAGAEAEVLEAIQVALELGNDINAVDNNGETAMHGAAYKNYPEAVKLLAKRGADPAIWNRKNKHGWTPLIIAEGHRFGNFKPSAVTVAALHEVMKTAGIQIPAVTASAQE